MLVIFTPETRSWGRNLRRPVPLRPEDIPQGYLDIPPTRKWVLPAGP